MLAHILERLCFCERGGFSSRAVKGVEEFDGGDRLNVAFLLIDPREHHVALECRDGERIAGRKVVERCAAEKYPQQPDKCERNNDSHRKPKHHPLDAVLSSEDMRNLHGLMITDLNILPNTLGENNRKTSSCPPRLGREKEDFLSALAL